MNNAFNQYPKLCSISTDFLDMCERKGIFKSVDGKQLIQKIENYLNGEKINDEKLVEAINAWYNGTFCPGYYMNNNDAEFAQYLKSRISLRIIPD